VGGSYSKQKLSNFFKYVVVALFCYCKCVFLGIIVSAKSVLNSRFKKSPLKTRGLFSFQGGGPEGNRTPKYKC
jgi:hypothetical protein